MSGLHRHLRTDAGRTAFPPSRFLLASTLLVWSLALAAAPRELVSRTAPDDVPERLRPYFGGRYRVGDGRLVDRILIPGRRPSANRQAIPPATLTRSSVLIEGVPAFIWTYGCSPTVAGMLCGMLDREGYANIYTGDTNGGVCPLSNAAWGGTGTGEGAEGECSFVASHMGIDGRETEGHVDDYYSDYGSNVDPYYGVREPHNQPGEGDCLADFMGTSQYYPAELGQADGFTQLYLDPAGGPYADTEFGDGLYGVKLFLQYCGYEVDSYFNQYVDTYMDSYYGIPDAGFTLADYQAEIDAGRPVMLHVDGHSMLGIGYDQTGQTVYLYDTWDYVVHEMTWGGFYSDMQLYGVSVLRMRPGDPQPGDYYSGGSGTTDEPYLISTKQDLLDLRATTADYHRHFRLTANIDLSGETFHDAILAPDPDNTNTTFDGVSFSGTFDGGGFTISNFTIDSNGVIRDYLGLFGQIEGSGREVVTDLRIENATIVAFDESFAIAALCGYLWYGTIRDCQVEATITAGDAVEWVGALCGMNEGGELRDCSGTVDVTVGEVSASVGGLCGTNWEATIAGCGVVGTVAAGLDAYYVGGLCGENTAEYGRESGALIEDSSATVVVSASASEDSDHASLGGLCGDNYLSIIYRSYATGTVSAAGDLWGAGGLCGRDLWGIIQECYATGDVEAPYVAGGLCGYESGGEIVDCYASGTVAGTGYLGGLCGWHDYGGTIYRSCATGAVVGGDYAYYLGGLCGMNADEMDDSSSLIADCYARGSVTGGTGSSEMGGLCGMNDVPGQITRCYATGEVLGDSLLGGVCGTNEGTITDCFWDIETSGISTRDGAVGRTTAQMQTAATFTDAGWDFTPDTGIWKMVGDVPAYPSLFWEPDVWTLQLAKGWNLVSLPLEPVDPLLESVLGNASARDGTVTSAILWNPTSQAYAAATELHACVGYWVYATEAMAVAITGTSVTTDQWSLSAGWNLLGTRKAYAAPADDLILGIYFWNPVTLRYGAPRSALAAGLGYWVLAESAGTLDLSAVTR